MSMRINAGGLNHAPAVQRCAGGEVDCTPARYSPDFLLVKRNGYTENTPLETIYALFFRDDGGHFHQFYYRTEEELNQQRESLLSEGYLDYARDVVRLSYPLRAAVIEEMSKDCAPCGYLVVEFSKSLFAIGVRIGPGDEDVVAFSDTKSVTTLVRRLQKKAFPSLNSCLNGNHEGY